jgi:hypothetical protein
VQHPQTAPLRLALEVVAYLRLEPVTIRAAPFERNALLVDERAQRFAEGDEVVGQLDQRFPNPACVSMPGRNLPSLKSFTPVFSHAPPCVYVSACCRMNAYCVARS